MKQLWYRFLAWTWRERRNAYIRVELVGSLDSAIERIADVHGCIVVFTRYGSMYRVGWDYGYIGLRMQRVA